LMTNKQVSVIYRVRQVHIVDCRKLWRTIFGWSTEISCRYLRQLCEGFPFSKEGSTQHPIQLIAEALSLW